MRSCLLHVFKLDMTEAEIIAAGLAALVPGHAMNVKITPPALTTLLGNDTVVGPDVEIFDVAEMAGLTLYDYLVQGQAVDVAKLDADRAMLEGVRGYVLILYDPIGAKPFTLQPDPRLTLLGSYAEELPPVTFERLPDADAQGTLTPAPAKAAMSDARVGGMVATVVLVFLAVFVVVFVWMGS